MNKILYILLIALFVSASVSVATAGNPDRQGEAGAYELLMVPWARTAGLHAMNTANVSGVDALRLNVAGLSRINSTEVVLGHSRYLVGTGINMNALGLSQKVGKSGAFGLSIMALDFGDIAVTTTDLPEGTGATFSPAFLNIGFAYSYTFENKISVGVLFRGVSESIADVSSFGFALDAGVQYVNESFKIGVSLRNIGSKMSFGGEGLSVQRPTPNDEDYQITYETRSAGFELPSMLNIGIAYDFLFGTHRLTTIGNFTSNSFSQDQVGAGLEYSLNDMFMLRAAYKYEFGSEDEITGPIYTGLSAGASINVPLSKENKYNTFGIDYAYRPTKVWDATHNFSVRFTL